MVDYTLENTPMNEEAEAKAILEFAATGIRTWLLSTTSREKRYSGSAVRWAAELGCLLWYELTETHRGRKARPMIDVDAMVAKWHRMIVGLAVAHDKDEADRYEACVDECLNPILSAQLSSFESLRRRSVIPSRPIRRCPISFGTGWRFGWTRSCSWRRTKRSRN